MGVEVQHACASHSVGPEVKMDVEIAEVVGEVVKYLVPG